MKLSHLRLTSFQSFGPIVTEISLDDTTFLIGPNGSGKTAILQALCRLFAFLPSQRRIQPSDFHVPLEESEQPNERSLVIEADIQIPECGDDEEDHSTIPPFFGHMRLDDDSDVPRVRYRLTATMGINRDIEERLQYVTEVDEEGEPVKMSSVSRSDRNYLCIHYLPAKRDPSDHIAYGTTALLGRLLRATDWSNEKEHLAAISEDVNTKLSSNPSVAAIDAGLGDVWKSLNRSSFFSHPSIAFAKNDISSILEQITVSFTPGHGESSVDYSRLSDGQKSLLYLSLVLSVRAIECDSISGDKPSGLDPEKAQIPVFTLVALEEPENSLSPHYLGRIVSALKEASSTYLVQSVVATHSPSMLYRVDPRHIRHTRLDSDRETQITSIVLPDETTDSETCKYVQEAIQAYPEIYFARFVVLGEGDSERMILPRILRAKGLPVDECGIVVAPLGGRHVNHFWRLLNELGIPHVTLLDLDLSRHQGGWGRVRYAAKQLKLYRKGVVYPSVGTVDEIPKWNNSDHRILEVEVSKSFIHYIAELEEHSVFFSSPLDIDFSMIFQFQSAYGIDDSDLSEPDESAIVSVLGKDNHDPDQYTEKEKSLFLSYHQLFKIGSKPASHLKALASLDDTALAKKSPKSLNRMAAHIAAILKDAPE